MPNDLPSEEVMRERLTAMTNELINTITSTVFVERMRTFRSAPPGEVTFANASQLLSLESLRSAGANLPEDFRVTSRYFEDVNTGERFDESVRDPMAERNVAWSGCAGGGAAGVCGCAGGSTQLA